MIIAVTAVDTIKLGWKRGLWIQTSLSLSFSSMSVSIMIHLG